MERIILIHSIYLLAGLIALIYFMIIFQMSKLIRKIFKDFLRIEKISTDFTKDFYNYLSQKIMDFYKADNIFLYTVKENTIFLESSSNEEDEGWNNICQSFEKAIGGISLDMGERDFIQEISKLFPEKYKNINILPVYQNKKPHAFFIMVYNNWIYYFLSRTSIYINSSRLKEYVYEFISVIKERHQNISMMTIGSIKDYAFISIDVKFYITSWNRGAEIMFGFHSSEVVNKAFTDLIDKGSIQKFGDSIKSNETAEEIKIELLLRDCNSTGIISEILLKKILIDEITFGYYIVIKDITKEEVWKNNIIRQALINKSIVENARDGIFLLNEFDRIIFLNEKVKKVIDAGASYLGVEITQVLPREFGEKVRAKIYELRKSSEELVFLNYKIGEFWYNIRFFPIKSGDHFDGVLIFFIDNTYIMNTREQLEEMNENLLSDLQAARTMQLGLIPAILPDNQLIRFKSIFIPSDEVGGDFYYVDEINIGQKKYYISMLADISGHGVGASMLTVLVKDVYNDFKNSLKTKEDLRLSQFLKMLNKKLINLDVIGSKFITVFIMLIDPDGKLLQFSSAGHPNAIILRKGEEIILIGSKNAPPLGIIDAFVYLEGEKEIYPKDKICLFSDGILDIFNNELDLFHQFMTQHKDDDLQQIKIEIEKEIENLKKKIETENLNRLDDITLVLIEII